MPRDPQPSLEPSRLQREIPLWAVLRCHPFQTLDLADSLPSCGLAGWVPRIRIHRRLPRRRKAEVRVAALLPSFVFVPFVDADQALALGDVGRVPRNWPFVFNGHRPALPVTQLAALEQASATRPDALDRFGSFRIGQKVNVLYGPMQGRAGTIVGRKGKARWMVELADGGLRVLVPSFLLQPIGTISSAG